MIHIKLNLINMKKLITLSFIGILGLFIASCGGDKSTEQTAAAPAASTEASAPATENGNPSYDPERGEGKFKDVEVGATLDVPLADAGNKVYDVKCSSCHKLTDEKLVGPGWAGVSKRRTPTWLMNFITNTNDMIDKDPELQAQLELCLVRMPNQSLTDDEARQLLEFMRKNDGVK